PWSEAVFMPSPAAPLPWLPCSPGGYRWHRAKRQWPLSAGAIWIYRCWDRSYRLRIEACGDSALRCFILGRQTVSIAQRGGHAAREVTSVLAPVHPHRVSCLRLPSFDYSVILI